MGMLHHRDAVRLQTNTEDDVGFLELHCYQLSTRCQNFPLASFLVLTFQRAHRFSQVWNIYHTSRHSFVPFVYTENNVFSNISRKS